ncbi:MAG: hypothetical protein COT18_03670 [Elusimicrobia bacterium CG08_land_8_20_14_0_20_59_10]|nr:MAG: hypothetical protein COT18_03670 [Elusimicrobia bacterium CG08_land_8_20_14_0_20_59_10]
MVEAKNRRPEIMADNERKRQPASKDDLVAVKTELKKEIADVKTELKSDIAQVRSGLANLDQKVSTLDQKVDTLGIEGAKTQLNLFEFKNDIMTALREFKSELLSAFEESAMKGQKYDQKALTHGDILNGHEDKLLNHENRITLLETKK